VELGDRVEVGDGVNVEKGVAEGDGDGFESNGMMPEKIKLTKMTTINTTAMIAPIKGVRLFLVCECGGGGGGGG
jgi:hypothetical protein